MAARIVDNRKDILLLLLYSPGAAGKVGEPISGRTRLTKMIFLFQKEILKEFRANVQIPEDKLYKFFPWNFGPFSREAYDDITFFLLRGFIESSISDDEALPESAAEWDKWLSGNSSFDDEETVTEYEEESFCLSKKGFDFTTAMYLSLTENQKNILAGFKARMQKAPLRAILRYVYEKYDSMTEKSIIKNDILRKP